MTRRSKILMICQLPPPTHGASIMNSYLVNSEMINTNYFIETVNLQFSSSLQKIEKFSFGKIFKTFKYIFIIIKKLVTVKPELVYFTISSKGPGFWRDVFFVLILKLQRAKILYHLHGRGIEARINRSRFEKAVYKWIFKNAYIICLTDTLAREIKDIYKASPFIVPNGIENKGRKIPIKNQNNQSPTILFLSNLVKTKGVLVLIDALHLVKTRGYSFSANIVGAPYDVSVDDLTDYVNLKNLENSIVIKGPKYGIEKEQEFANADIFVFPTFYSNETFGLVNLEAMQNALPVISTKEGGIPDVVLNNDTGFIVEPKNAEQLAEKIAVLLQDRVLRESMGTRGYHRYLENFTLNHFENNVNTVFEKVLNA